MAVELNNAHGTSIAWLLRGIIDDVQVLIRQQLLMFRSEIRGDLQQCRNAAIMLAIGAGVIFIGAFLVLLMLPLLLNWLLPQLPLWACFGIMGFIMAAAGGTVLYAGIRQYKAITPADQSVEALKENLRWTTHLR
jgi:hypothetical protein